MIGRRAGQQVKQGAQLLALTPVSSYLSLLSLSLNKIYSLTLFCLIQYDFLPLSNLFRLPQLIQTYHAHSHLCALFIQWTFSKWLLYTSHGSWHEEPKMNETWNLHLRSSVGRYPWKHIVTIRMIMAMEWINIEYHGHKEKWVMSMRSPLLSLLNPAHP